MKALSRIAFFFVIIIGGILCLPLLFLAILSEAFNEENSDDYHRD